MNRQTRRDFLRVLGLTAGSLITGGSVFGKQRASRKPNVILIFTDDQGTIDVNCYGSKDLYTSNLDRLAREGALFENMFVTTSLCSPSRASFLSGLYAHSHGVMNNFTDYPTSLASYPRRLQEAGYNTAYIGKWHMGEQDDEKRPGFDYWITQ